MTSYRYSDSQTEVRKVCFEDKILHYNEVIRDNPIDLYLPADHPLSSMKIN